MYWIKFSYLMISISMILPILNHPISLGSILILQTILMCSNLNIYSETSWYSYILFITMIGGMMIMFMYMASIASNEKFKFNKWLMTTVLMMLIMLNLMEKTDNTIEYFMKTKEMKMLMFQMNEMKSTMKFFNMNKSMITIMMILTLLITMIAVTNIANTFEGPLKKSYV